jgi:hypothetical protein
VPSAALGVKQSRLVPSTPPPSDGRRVLDETPDEVILEELTREMAGGRELAELRHELKH